MHQQKLLTVESDLRAGELAEENTIAWLALDGGSEAAISEVPRTDGDDSSLLWFLLGGVRDTQACGVRAGCVVMTPDEDFVVEWLEMFHGSFLFDRRKVRPVFPHGRAEV